ncbi:MAG: type II toxin-antitoxin system RelE/ParE family toxin [Leptospirales bacterium]|nr:type II toxin-antitoxin system RelE/ParE family toxin [Leptospirales bacterium]
MDIWKVITSEKFDAWFLEQSDDDKAAILSKIYLLEEYGPNLSRPYADTIKGSKKLSNLKELRIKTSNHVFRVTYIFDPARKGLLLTGGDKKGKDEKKFYKDLIRESEQIYAVYLEMKDKNKEK